MNNGNGKNRSLSAVDDLIVGTCNSDVPPTVRRRMEVQLAVLRRQLDERDALSQPTDGPHETRGGANCARRSLWSRSRVAASVGIAAAVGLAALILLSGPASLTLAQVREAVNGRPWIHVRYDDGREEWIAPTEGKLYQKREDGNEVLLIDMANNIRHSHGTGSEYILEDQPVIYPAGEQPRWTAKTAWQYVVGPYEQVRNEPDSPWTDLGPGRVEEHTESVDGQELIRFDLFRKNALGNEVPAQQLWADPETRLPVRIRKRLSPVEQQAQGSWITGVYSFPEDGPKDLYDLGVPRTVAVVRAAAPRDGAAAAAVLDEARQAWKHFPKHYQAIIWPQTVTDERQKVSLVVASGEATRVETFLSLKAEKAAYHLSVPASAGQALQWCKNQKAVSIYLTDGKRLYERNNRHPSGILGSRRAETVRIMDAHAESFASGLNPLTGLMWPELNRAPRHDLLPRTPETPDGCVGLRYHSGHVREDFYLDTVRDHLCVKKVWWQKDGEEWRKSEEVLLGGLRQLPGGQWVPGTVTYIRHGQDEDDGDAGHTVRTLSVNVEVASEGTVPAAVFDPQVLMEGATIQVEGGQ